MKSQSSYCVSKYSNYGTHFIIQTIGKQFDFKINVMPNELEKKQKNKLQYL